MIFFSGKIENGNLRINKIDEFHSYIKKWEGKEVQFSIKRKSKKRTESQNAYYWACMNVIAEDTGNDPEILHNTFKAKFLVDHSGKFPVVRSTTELGTIEFGDYIEKIRVFVADFGIELQSPEDYFAQEFSKNFI